MFLVSVLKKYWQELTDDKHTLDRLRTLEILRDEYTEETRLIRQFTRHSERMRYPPFRERLLRMAQEQSEHVSWLREKIVELHGLIPEVEETPTPGKNSWECLLQDLAEEKRCCALLADRIAIAENFYPELTAELEHMFEEENQHREEIIDMLMKSDPYAEQ
jgi:bacterioferritin (cytochrome b1)